MYKTKFLFIVALAVFSLVLWGSHSFAQSNEWVEGTVQGGYPVRGWDAFEASWLIGHKVVSPDYDGYLGQISDLLIDRSNGRVLFVVLSDTPGAGMEPIAVPFSALVRTGYDTFQLSFAGLDVPLANMEHQYYNALGDRYARFLAKNRGTIGMTTIPASIDPLWADSVYEFYGLTPYWTEGKTPHPDIVSFRETKMLGAEIVAPGSAYVEKRTAVESTPTCPPGAKVESREKVVERHGGIETSGNIYGRIDDLIIDYPDGRVAFVVLDHVPGRAGDALVAVPFSELSWNGNAYVLNISGDQLAGAPAFVLSDINNPRRAEEIYIHFGVTPYWTEHPMPSSGY